jgi:hypothetical protein
MLIQNLCHGTNFVSRSNFLLGQRQRQESRGSHHAARQSSTRPGVAAHALSVAEAAALSRARNSACGLRRATMPHAVQVSGASAASINGVYRPVAGERVGGKPVYKKDGADTWIEYWPGTEQWQVKPGSDKGKGSAWMVSQGNQKEARIHGS